MRSRISLGLVIHNHQPVGNFGWVVAEVFEKAYRPLLEALERHPGIRVGLHYTGPLVEWLRAEQPRFIDRVGELAARGQVELLGGGWFEPILASLPERDRVSQLTRMADELEATFGRRPAGAWLAERVWEPSLPTSIVEAGYAWTVLDDAHFRAASVPDDRLWGAYTTEDQGRLLTVFGTEQGLRYGIPFGEVEDVIAHLQLHATPDGDRLGVMGDDGEKFGGWPTTWEHCWGRGRWVERFFAALEANRDWLSPVTPSGWLADRPPIGRVYLPTSSYAEMGEWALPPDESAAYSEALRQVRKAERPMARWLRGGLWRNFQVRYREVNDLHKQMLRVSAKVEAMPDGPARARALDHLGRGQSNDVYWHGLFGGIYLADLRVAAHHHLIAAEDEADRVLGTTTTARVVDLDLDGRPDVLLADEGQVVTIDLDEGAGIGAWDIRAVAHPVGAVLRRRPEAYHERLLDIEPATPVAVGDLRDPGAASIHDLVQSKETGLSERLHLDPFERRSGLVRFLASDATGDHWAAGTATELGDAVEAPYEVASLEPGLLTAVRAATFDGPGGAVPVKVTKRLTLEGDRRSPTIRFVLDVENTGDRPVFSRLGIEWSTMLLGGGGNPAAWWELGGRRTRHDEPGEAQSLESIAQGNDDLGIAIRTMLAPAMEAWWAPIETVSNSEAGFERVYQGAGLLVSRVVEIAPGERVRIEITHTVEVDPDRTPGPT